MQNNFSDESIFTAVNALRTHPQSILDQLKSQLNRFESNHVQRTRTDSKVRTMSGKAAWQDCIIALERQKSKNALTWSKALEVAAKKYKQIVISNPTQMSPQEAIKKIIFCEGKLTCHIADYKSQQSMSEFVASLVVGDDDQHKSARTAIFNPAYQVYACSQYHQGANTKIVSLFAQSARIVQQDSDSNSVMSKSEQQTGAFKSISKSNCVPVPLNQQDCLKRGRQFIIQLNKVRKDPKNYIHIIKAEIDKFKDENTCITAYGSIILKQGKTAYYDLISELETQYTLPSVREVSSLSVISAKQVKEYETIPDKHNRTSFEALLDKYCSQHENVRSFKLKDVHNWPISAIVMSMLLGDNDKKRTMRKKLMSPICKAIGAAISQNIAMVNIGEMAKDNKQTVKQYLAENSLSDKPSSPMNQVIKQEASSMQKDRIIVKRSTKSRKQLINGLYYQITQIRVTYNTGEVENIIEEQLVK